MTSGKRKKRKRQKSRIHPQHQLKKTISPQNSTAEESYNSDREMAIMSDMPLTPPKTKDANQGIYEYAPRWKIVLEVLAFSVLVVYTIFAGLQWRSMRSQLQVMQDTLNLERPWIGPISRTMYPKAEVGHLIAVAWHFKNGGRTVATRIRTNLEFRIGPLPIDKIWPKFEVCNPDKELEGEGGNVSIPGAEDKIVIGTIQVEKSLDDVYAHKVGLYLVRCIHYSDTGRKSWYRTEVNELYAFGRGFISHTSGNDAR